MSKIKIIPCSGIGKVYGLMSRETALKITNELFPENTEIVWLAHIVTGDDDAKAKIEGQTCITIDGCPKMCAAKNSTLAGGIVKEEHYEMVNKVAQEINKKFQEILNKE